MRSFYIGLTLLGTLLPGPAAAQVYQLPTPPPIASASDAPWRGTGQPIYYAGGVYYPSGPTEFFDGQIMARSGVVDGVAVYENKTLEPWSIVLVPTPGGLMQPYERRRAGALGGTVGSRTPGQPIQRDGDSSLANDSMRDGDIQGFPVTTSGRAQWTWPTPPPATVDPPPLAPLSPRGSRGLSVVPVIRSIPQRETTNAGPYVDFAGAHYYSSGKAVVHDSAKFTRLGDLGGAALYREIGGSEKTIHVQVVPEGALAPYTRR
jgi:hypothetical protein